MLKILLISSYSLSSVFTGCVRSHAVDVRNSFIFWKKESSMVSSWALGGIFWWPTKSTPQLSVGSASKLMPRKVYPKFKLLFNFTTTVQVHYAYTDLASCFVLSWSCKSFWRGKKKRKKKQMCQPTDHWSVSKEVRAASERNWDFWGHTDTNGPAGPALGLGYKWHIKQMVAHSRLVKRVNLVDKRHAVPVQ